jgi:hypothetical protein
MVETILAQGVATDMPNATLSIRPLLSISRHFDAGRQALAES